MPRYKLRTLLILLAVGPPVLAAFAMMAELIPVNSTIVAVVAYIGLVASLLAVSKVMESRGIQQPESVNPYFESQAETFDRQTKETDRLLKEQEESMRRSDELRSKQESNAERMESLLVKMEEQARRKDAILDAEEKQLGINE